MAPRAMAGDRLVAAQLVAAYVWGAPVRSPGWRAAAAWPRAPRRSVVLRSNPGPPGRAGRHPREPRSVGLPVARPRPMPVVVRQHPEYPEYPAGPVGDPMVAPVEEAGPPRQEGLAVLVGDPMVVLRVVVVVPMVVRSAVLLVVRLVAVAVRREGPMAARRVAVAARRRREACLALGVHPGAGAERQALLEARRVLGVHPGAVVPLRLVVRRVRRVRRGSTSRPAWLHRRRRRSPWRSARTGSSSVLVPPERLAPPVQPASRPSTRGSSRRRHRTSRHRRS